MSAITARLAPHSWIDELRGGLNATLIIVPICISYGLLTFAPLGPSFASAGILAALLAAIIAPLACSAFGMRSPQIFVSRGVSNVVLAAFLTEFVATRGGQVDAALAAQAVLLFVLMLGLLELVFGIARIGSMAKYLPAPVVAGLQCGVALALLLSQASALFGIAQPLASLTLAGIMAEIRPLAALVAATTIATVVLLTRHLPRAPAFAIALLVGTMLHALLDTMGAASWLGGTLGAMSVELPDFEAFSSLILAPDPSVLLPLLPIVFSWALTASVISTADSLIGFKIVDEMTDRKLDADRELMRNGAANIVGALAGAMHAGLNSPATVTNYRLGGRGALSSIFGALAIAVVGIGLLPFLSDVPYAAIAAMLTVVGVRMFDPWTIQIARQSLRRKLKFDPDVLGMLGTVAVVASLAVLVNFLVAVLVGLAIAVVSFIWRMSHSIIRRRYSGRDLQSRNIRAPAVRDILLDQGTRIVVFELEGPLFFGSGEKFTASLERLVESDALVIVADMQHLTDVDSTGVRLLATELRRLSRHGKHLILSGIHPHSRVARLLAEFGLGYQAQSDHADTGIKMFHDIDQALEWAEDTLLATLGRDGRTASATLAGLEMLGNFSADELERMRPYLVETRFKAGTTIFAAGETGRALYAIASGSASVTLAKADSQQRQDESEGDDGETRIVTFSSGAFFGEFALLDGQPRSATVRADTDLVCYVLDGNAFLRLQREQPICTIKLLTNLGRELALRLRDSNQTIRALLR